MLMTIRLLRLLWIIAPVFTALTFFLLKESQEWALKRYEVRYGWALDKKDPRTQVFWVCNTGSDELSGVTAVLEIDDKPPHCVANLGVAAAANNTSVAEATSQWFLSEVRDCGALKEFNRAEAGKITPILNERERGHTYYNLNNALDAIYQSRLSAPGNAKQKEVIAARFREVIQRLRAETGEKWEKKTNVKPIFKPHPPLPNEPVNGIYLELNQVGAGQSRYLQARFCPAPIKYRPSVTIPPTRQQIRVELEDLAAPRLAILWKYERSLLLWLGLGLILYSLAAQMLFRPPIHLAFNLALVLNDQKEWSRTLGRYEHVIVNLFNQSCDNANKTSHKHLMETDKLLRLVENALLVKFDADQTFYKSKRRLNRAISNILDRAVAEL